MVGSKILLVAILLNVLWIAFGEWLIYGRQLLAAKNTLAYIRKNPPTGVMKKSDEVFWGELGLTLTKHSVYAFKNGELLFSSARIGPYSWWVKGKIRKIVEKANETIAQ